MVSAVSMGISCIRHKPRWAVSKARPPGAPLGIRSMMGSPAGHFRGGHRRKYNGNRTCTAISRTWSRTPCGALAHRARLAGPVSSQPDVSHVCLIYW
jgi:hypothetical protein